MVRRFHRSIYDELDELRASMDYLYLLALDPADSPQEFPGETPEILCGCLHPLNAEVAVHGNEVIVTMNTVPGTGNSRTTIDLVDEATLSIALDYPGDERAEYDGSTEERSISLNRVIRLPAAVVTAGARVTWRHGVLDIHLRTAAPARS